MWQELAVALSLVLVIEGILPFLNPRQWQKVLWSLAQMDARSVRLIGLGSMLTGLVMLYLVK